MQLEKQSMKVGLCDFCAKPIVGYNAVASAYSEFRRNHTIIIGRALYKFCTKDCKKRLIGEMKE